MAMCGREKGKRNRGGGKLSHEKDRAGCGCKGKLNQGKFIFRMGQKASTLLVGKEERT